MVESRLQWEQEGRKVGEMVFCRRVCSLHRGVVGAVYVYNGFCGMHMVVVSSLQP
jgi:hypothetical protein